MTPPQPLSVWAPNATTVHAELIDPGRSETTLQPLTADSTASGWWRSSTMVDPGTAYRFVVDGRPTPDPRSPCQPDGVDGPSVTVDHDQFPWTDQEWRPGALADAVIYELHVGTFTPAGTFRAVLDKLDHLVDLGITHIELMPVATFDGDHGWGYDGVSLFAPHAAYGDPADLKALVDGCHHRGLAVILDVVYNHLGPVGNHLSRFGPYFTDRYATPWGEAVNLDGPGSPEVRQFIIDNACMWLCDYHFDGLRLDAVHELFDTSAIHLLEQLAFEVERLAHELGRPLVLVAENDTNDPRLVHPRSAGGYALDAHWCDDVHHAIHTVLSGESAGYYADYVAAEGFGVLDRALRQGYVYDGRYSPARAKVVGRPPDGLTGANLVACIQNHDQVGNRAAGDRFDRSASLQAQQVAAALLLTGPFVPLLFQGEEWAASSPFPFFADHRDPALIEAVRRGRQEEFASLGWAPEDVTDPESGDTFQLAQLRWDEIDQPRHQAMLSWYQSLIAWRRRHVGLLDHQLDAVVTVDPDARTIHIRRGEIQVAANCSTRPRLMATGPTIMLASTPPVKTDADQTRLGPMSVVISRCAPATGWAVS